LSGSADAAPVRADEVRKYWSSDVVLADGRVVQVRPLDPGDLPSVRALLDGLTPQSLRMRFFSPRAPSDADMAKMLDVDYRDTFTLGVEMGTELIGMGSYHYESERASAEVAFTVADAHHAQGIGTLLLEHLVAAALSNGIQRFHAATLGDNRQMLDVFRHAGFAVSRSLEAGVFDLEFDLSIPADGAVADRERIAETRSVARLLAPQVVAVIGASRTPGTVGNAVLVNICEYGFAGIVHPVNPHASSIGGLKCYPSIADVPDHVDLAIITVPAEAVAGVLAECGEAGVHGAVILSAGFAEVGTDGHGAEAALVRLARRYGMRLIGPNCVGIINTAPDVNLDATFAPTKPVRGSVGFVSQSGALGIAVLEAAESLGLGISSFVSLGNKADISGNDLLQYWEDDPATDVALLYLESFGNPTKFNRLARRFSRRKPIVAVKSGRSEAGKRAASSHTAALATDDILTDTLFRQTGIIRVDTLAQMFDVTRVLVHQPLPAGRRVAIVGNSGGPGILAADACSSAGLTVPELSQATRAALADLLGPNAGVRNPVDLLASAGAGAYEQALRLVLADEAVDAVIVIYTDPMISEPAAIIEAVRRAASSATHKTMLACFLARDLPPAIELVPPAFGDGDENDVDGDGGARVTRRAVPVFPFPESPAVALGRIAELARWRSRPVGTVVVPDGYDGAAVREVVREALNAQSELSSSSPRPSAWMAPEQLRALLAAAGISMVPQVVAGSATEAAAAATALGLPVAMKVIAPDVLHKSDVGGVALGLATTEAVARAYDDMARRVPGMSGAVLQPMAEAGVETIVGIVRDDLFGSVVMFGLGGTAAELFADRAFQIVPMTDVDAAELVRAPKSAPLLTGYRGSVPVDLDAIEDLLLRIGTLATTVPELAELDLNPVIATPTGLALVDGRCRIEAVLSPSVLPMRRMRSSDRG
jgi:acetyl coenzyme A synthetase (ADP forming)-like protein